MFRDAQLPSPKRVVFHDACSGLRQIGTPKPTPRPPPPSQRTRARRDGRPRRNAADFGGLFSIKHGDVSSRMAERKVEDLLRSKTPIASSDRTSDASSTSPENSDAWANPSRSDTTPSSSPRRSIPTTHSPVPVNREDEDKSHARDDFIFAATPAPPSPTRDSNAPLAQRAARIRRRPALKPSRRMPEILRDQTPRPKKPRIRVLAELDLHLERFESNAVAAGANRAMGEGRRRRPKRRRRNPPRPPSETRSSKARP